MILAQHHIEHPGNRGVFGGFQCDGHAALTILVGLVVIAVIVTLFATAGVNLGIELNLEPIAYLFIVLSVVVLLLTSLITFVRNEVRAAIYMLSFWGATLTGVCLLFYAFG